ncbi:MAG: YfiT family bacillithiol transferase [Gemmatimonas sp.]
MSTDLSYPIGRFQRPASLSDSEFQEALSRLSTQVARFRAAVAGLSDAQLDTPYRPGGWTVRQLAHHVADSHVNMYIRLKLALTEDNPTIKPYDQDAWVLLADVREIPIETSMQLFDAAQQRALAVLRNTSATDRARVFMHPENGPTRVDQMTALYAWHGDHHVAHVTSLRARMGW